MIHDPTTTQANLVAKCYHTQLLKNLELQGGCNCKQAHEKNHMLALMLQ